MNHFGDMSKAEYLKMLRPIHVDLPVEEDMMHTEVELDPNVASTCCLSLLRLRRSVIFQPYGILYLYRSIEPIQSRSSSLGTQGWCHCSQRSRSMWLMLGILVMKHISFLPSLYGLHID
jgi:hypothetical protein